MPCGEAERRLAPGAPWRYMPTVLLENALSSASFADTEEAQTSALGLLAWGTYRKERTC